MKLTYSATEDEWKILSMVASKNNKGRSLTSMLAMGLEKRFGKTQQPECSEDVSSVISEGKVKKSFDVPSHLQAALVCAAKRAKVSPATLVRRLLIDPILVEHFFGSEVSVSDETSLRRSV